MDYVVQNPPFNLSFKTQEGDILSQLYCCKKAAQVLKPLGIMATIVPMSFLADTFSDKHMIEQMENDFSFASFGVDAFPTKVQFWQKKSHNEDWQPQRYRPEMTLDVTDFSDTMVDKVREVIVAAAQTELRSKKKAEALEKVKSLTQVDFDFESVNNDVLSDAVIVDEEEIE